MPKFLVRASYDPEGVKGILTDGGTGRRAAVQKMIEASGGSLEAMYFAFGSHDVYAIADMPDNTAHAALMLRVAASGRVRGETVVLLTPEEVDEAVAKDVEYVPPGS